MEILVFALAIRNGYHWQDAFVPELAEFRPFERWNVRTTPRTILRADRLIGGNRLWPRSHLNRVNMLNCNNTIVAPTTSDGLPERDGPRPKTFSGPLHLGSPPSDTYSLLDTEIYRIFREYLQHEDGLANNRLSWMLTIHGFLYASYAFTIQTKLQVGGSSEK